MGTLSRYWLLSAPGDTWLAHSRVSLGPIPPQSRKLRGHPPHRLSSPPRGRPTQPALLRIMIDHRESLPEMSPERLRAAVSGDEAAVTQLLDVVLPVIQARVARALLRRAAGRGRAIEQEVADLTQEVFVALFADDAKALRGWDPERGLSLANFVGLLAERRAASLLRTKHRNPWSEEPQGDDLETGVIPEGQMPDAQVGSRQLLERLLEELRGSLSPQGLELFYRLYVDEQAVAEICEQTGLSTDAVYKWRSRLRQAARAAMASFGDDSTYGVSGEEAR